MSVIPLIGPYYLVNKLWLVVKGMFDIVPCPTKNPTTDMSEEKCVKKCSADMSGKLRPPGWA